MAQFCKHCEGGEVSEVNDRTLLDLSVVSKDVRAIVLPLLLHRPVLNPASLPLLINFLFENEELAKYVRWVYYEVTLKQTDASTRFAAKDLKLVATHPESGQDLFLQDYIHNDENRWDLKIQVFLSMATNIQKLWLRGDWERGLFGHLANRFSQLEMSTLFPNLREVLIEGNPSPFCTEGGPFISQERKVNCRFVLGASPKVQTLVLYGMGRDSQRVDADVTDLLEQPLSTNLKDIQFLNSTFLGSEEKTFFLEPIIHHCLGLERFTMHMRICECLTDFPLHQPVSPGELVEILESQKATLQYLDLNFIDPSDWVHHSDDPLTPGQTVPSPYMKRSRWYIRPSLLEFTALKELRIDEQSFCRQWRTRNYNKTANDPRSGLTNIVPKSVTKLSVLVRPMSRAWRDIRHFAMEVKRGEYPNLQVFKLVFVMPVEVRRLYNLPRLTEEPTARFVKKVKAVMAKLDGTGVQVQANRTFLRYVFGFGEGVEVLDEDLTASITTEMHLPPFSLSELHNGRCRHT